MAKQVIEVTSDASKLGEAVEYLDKLRRSICHNQKQVRIEQDRDGKEFYITIHINGKTAGDKDPEPDPVNDASSRPDGESSGDSVDDGQTAPDQGPAEIGEVSEQVAEQSDDDDAVGHDKEEAELEVQ